VTHVLFTVSPGLGHIHPMVPLARALAGRGHEVRWAVAPEVQRRVEASGFETFPAGIGFGPRFAEYHRRHPDTESIPPPLRPERMFPVIFGEIAAPPMLADLQPVMRDWKPALVVHDAAELAGPIAAAQAGVPSVNHGFGALLPETRVAAAGEAVAPLWRSAGLEPRPYAGSYDYLYLDIYPPSMRLPGDAHVTRRQPLRPVPFDAVESDAAPWVMPASDRPLVYVTFGTVFNDVSPTFTAAVHGVAELDVDVLVTVGPTGDPAALGPLPDNVRVERYVPQTFVLPQCATLVSHAGSGTVLAALALGLPQLCLPQAADQFINATQASAVGAAIALTREETSASSVADAVGRLLDDPAYREGAARLSKEIEAMPGPDEVAAVLEDLV
jgi:UDP:flavonoid glycosyltransferase YjiC (YdhE family)